jgi:hypothetical protein
MKYLLLSVLFTFTSLHADDNELVCQDLDRMAGQMLKEINHKRADKCDEITPEAIGRTSAAKTDLEAYRCKDLAAIESKLKTLDSEIALLKGFEKSREEVLAGQKKLQEMKKPELLQTAAKSFLSNLAIAQTMELMLATNSKKSDNIFQKLAEKPEEEWDQPSELGSFIESFCKDNPQSGVTICSAKVTITPELFRTIRTYTGLGAQTKRKFNKSQIKDLQQALAIKKEDGKEYSFNDLANELKDMTPDGIITEAQLKSIQSLPTLKKEKDYDFLAGLNSAKNVLDAQSAGRRFQIFLSDLKLRQEWELKSKLSYLLEENASKIPESYQAACLSAKELKKPAAECLEPLAKDNGLLGSQIKDIIQEFNYGEKHLSDLNKLMALCVPAADLTMPKECEGVVSAKLADLLEQAETLNSLRVYLMKGSSEKMLLYNYALEQMREKQCSKVSDTNIIACYGEVGRISNEAVALTSSVNGIVHILAKADYENDISKLCEEEETKKKDLPYLSQLCEIEDQNNNPEETKPRNPDDVMASVDPGSRNLMGDAAKEFALAAAGMIGRSLMPPMQPGVNPYAPIHPTPRLPPPQDIVSRITGPYIASGMTSFGP